MTELLQDRSGDIYVAVSGAASTRTTTPTAKPSAILGDAEDKIDDEHEDLGVPGPNISAGGRRGSSRGSTVFRIANDGLVRTFWSTPGDRIYAMILDASGNILVGTGDNGRLYSLTKSG